MSSKSPFASAKSWHVVCLDYVEDHCCFLCGHKLTIGKARVVEFPTGEQAFAGPSCAWVRADNVTKKIPDLTKFLTESSERGEHGALTPLDLIKVDRNEQVDPLKEKRADVEAYLRLRYERLAGVSGMEAIAFLTDAYEALRKGELEDKQISALWKSIHTIQERRPALSLESLKQLYFLWYWLNRCIKTLDKHSKIKYINSCIKNLKETWTLDSVRLTGALKYLEYLPGAPHTKKLNLPGRYAETTKTV